MGGTYIAVSDDTSGCYYNPAGTVYAYAENISAAGNAVYLQSNTIRGVQEDSTRTEGSYEREGQSFLANFIGVLRKTRGLTYCFSYAAPESNSEHQFDRWKHQASTYELDWNLEDRTSHFGPSIAGSLSRRVSWGASVHFHLRSGRTNVTERLDIDYDLDGSANIFSSRFFRSEMEESGLRYQVGLQWNPVEELVVGAVIDQLRVYNARTKFVRSITLFDVNFPEALNGGGSVMLEDTSLRETPVHVGVGVAYYRSAAELYALDVDYYSATGTNIPFAYPRTIEDGLYPFIDDGGPTPDEIDAVIAAQYPDRFALQPVINLSLGAEFYLNAASSLTIGAFTDRTSAPKAGASRVFQYEHVDLYGFSSAYSSHTPNATFTIGFSVSTGEGKLIINQLAPREVDTYPLKRNAWSLFLAVN